MPTCPALFAAAGVAPTARFSRRKKSWVVFIPGMVKVWEAMPCCTVVPLTSSQVWRLSEVVSTQPGVSIHVSLRPGPAVSQNN